MRQLNKLLVRINSLDNIFEKASAFMFGFAQSLSPNHEGLNTGNKTVEGNIETARKGYLAGEYIEIGVLLALIYFGGWI